MTALTTRPQSAGPPIAAGDLPFVSVIVPVRNEERFIRRTLEQLLGQDYAPERFEVLVADGRSTDRTRAVVGALMAGAPNLRLLDNRGRWSSAGRNAAIAAARGDIVVLVDGHCDLGSRQYLRSVVDAFRRSGADCLGRPQPLDVAGASTLQRAVAAARASWLGHHPDSFIFSSAEQFAPAHSVAVAYRRAVFETVGLFDESFDACEDVELNHRVDRAGLRCLFVPRIGARYFPRGTLTGLFRQMLRYGRGRVRLLRKHPDTFTLPCFLPAALVAGVALGAAVACLSPWLALAYAVALGLYGAVVGLVAVALSARARDVRLLPWLPAVFLAIHAGAGIGSWLELLRGRTGRRPTAAASPEQTDRTRIAA